MCSRMKYIDRRGYFRDTREDETAEIQFEDGSYAEWKFAGNVRLESLDKWKKFPHSFAKVNNVQATFTRPMKKLQWKLGEEPIEEKKNGVVVEAMAFPEGYQWSENNKLLEPCFRVITVHDSRQYYNPRVPLLGKES